MVALLVAGSATLLFSCGKHSSDKSMNTEALMTQKSDTLTLVYSQNGVKQYRFYTPLMERYELAREPYMEFRYGVDIVTFDSLDNVESTLISDYAIFYENRKLWEARGNVVATGQDGRTLYTQQLFWDQQTGRVYSNVDSKVVQDGDVFIGEGFESDDKFQNWTFRNYVGRITVDTSAGERTDSVSVPSGEAGRPASGRSGSDDENASSGSVSPVARRPVGPRRPPSSANDAFEPGRGSVREADDKAPERVRGASPRTLRPSLRNARPTEVASPVEKPVQLQPVPVEAEPQPDKP